MRKLLAIMFLLFTGNVAIGNEWMPYVHKNPAVIQTVPAIQNFQVIQNYYNYGAPVAAYYVPVTTYQDFLVEHKVWCFYKRYEIVRVPQTVYVPVKY